MGFPGDVLFNLGVGRPLVWEECCFSSTWALFVSVTTWGLWWIPTLTQAPARCFFLRWCRNPSIEKTNTQEEERAHPGSSWGGGGVVAHGTPTCSIASVLWLITELVSVCFCLMTQCIYTDFVIFPASQYWKSAELRGNTQTGVRNKKNKKKPTWYMSIWRFGGSVRAKLQKFSQVSL